MRHHSNVFFPVAAILLLLISPAFVTGLTYFNPADAGRVAQSVVVPLLIFLIPIAGFHRNLKTYFYLLLPLVLITPLFLFFSFYFAIPPGFELVAFIMQTNPREIKEAAGPFLVYFIPFELIFVGLYLMSVHKISRPRVSLAGTAMISGISFILLAVITWNVNGLRYKRMKEMNKHDLVLKYEYPVSLLSGLNEARVFLKKNTLKNAEHFTFRAVRQDTIQQRQIHVLVIGESSRYDRWQINGYKRATAPRLATEKDLITYSDVVAGSHYTWVSVPQIITRANPRNYDLQYREKSILAAFQEAGFKTIWLSNQSDQDIFWSGTITLHAKTANFSKFSPTWSPNLEYDNVYDGRLLPLLDSILQADDKNLFIVMHTMGNHWEYSRRYPREFDFFQPSGYTQSINPPDPLNREAILNSYDNSIRYADFVIQGAIDAVRRRQAISTVTFISDHGEDLFDANPDHLDFHFRPSASTLKVPLFIWTSPSYKSAFTGKRKHLELNAARKIGTENLFYTLLDVANISIESFDSTKSFASPHFVPSQQEFYGDDKHPRRFTEVHMNTQP